VTALYCIGHGQDRHRLEPLPPSKTVSLLLQQAFLPYWDRIGMEATLDFLVSFATQVPCYSLAFLKQADVVEYLQHHASTAVPIIDGKEPAPSPQSSPPHRGRGKDTSLDNTGLVVTTP
jgi:hypothetical protein